MAKGGPGSRVSWTRSPRRSPSRCSTASVAGPGQQVRARPVRAVGLTGNQEIPIAKSIVDYIFRWLGSRFLSPDEPAPLGLIDRSAIVAGFAGRGNASAPVTSLRFLLGLPSSTSRRVDVGPAAESPMPPRRWLLQPPRGLLLLIGAVSRRVPRCLQRRCPRPGTSPGRAGGDRHERSRHERQGQCRFVGEWQQRRKHGCDRDELGDDQGLDGPGRCPVMRDCSSMWSAAASAASASTAGAPLAAADADARLALAQQRQRRLCHLLRESHPAQATARLPQRAGHAACATPYIPMLRIPVRDFGRLVSAGRASRQGRGQASYRNIAWHARAS